MGLGNFNNLVFFTVKSFYLLLLALIICNPLVSEADVCDKVNCAQGTCKPSNASLYGYECDCFPGWKKFDIPPFPPGACFLPNCTVNLTCGSSSPPSPSPLLPPPPASLPVPTPCFLVWCNEGICVVNGTGHICQCNEGSYNAYNSSAWPCFKPCSLGADCNGFSLGPSTSPSAPSTQTSASAPPARAPSRYGPKETPNCSRNLCSVTMASAAAVFLSLVLGG